MKSAPPPLSHTQNTLNDHREGYVHRHSHDIRNYLGALDIQAMLLQGAASGPGEDRSVAIIRKVILCVEELQLRLCVRFRDPVPSEVSLSAVFEQCQPDVRIPLAESELEWCFDGPDCRIDADAESVSIIIAELADHFFSQGQGVVKAFTSEGNACFQMRRTAATESRELDADVTDELSALVARYGGTLTCGGGGQELTVAWAVVVSSQ